jgi:hypothetical protein
MYGERNISTPGGQKLVHMHPLRGGYVLGQLSQKSRGVAGESTKFHDRKGNEADVGATPHLLRVLLELAFLSTA